MLRTGFVLLFLIFVSSLGAVTSQYKVRTLFYQAEKEERLTLELENQFRQLQIEQTAASRHSYIGDVAKQQLGMVAVTPAHTVYIKKSEASVSVMTPVQGEP